MHDGGGSGFAGAASSPTQRRAARLDSAASRPPTEWVMTLNLVDKQRLLVMLSDGLLGCEVAQAEWPPTAATVLPEAVRRALARLDGARLRLQLGAALDAWPWEREIRAAVGAGRMVPRYLTDLPRADALLPNALVVSAGTRAGDLQCVHAAQVHQRPLVLTDAALPATQRLALERNLRSQWLGSHLLSDVLALVLGQLDLPLACCRLYGDGLAPVSGPEEGWRPVTALSVDLVGSTHLLQSLGAEAYAHRLQAYHERCRDVIQRFHGSLDTPQGDDGLMAYFGFPLAVEDAAAHALTAAWQLSQGIAELGLRARIGVASGRVAVSAQQAFGPEVHLAARLCAAAQPGQVLVAPSTQERVGPGFLLEPCVGSLSLKDFGDLKLLYRLDGVGVSSTLMGQGRGASGSGSFVGRHQELSLLRKAWQAACAGRLQWAVVHGEAGVGKSRLLLEFSRELCGQGQRCLALTGHAQLGSSPFAAVVDALRQHWAIDAAADAASLRHRLVALRVLPQTGDAEDFGVLARLLGLSRGDEGPPEPAGQRRWSDLLLECLQALVEPGPFCLFVDDVHWLDPSSVDLLRRLRAACAARPLLVVSGERSAPGRALQLPGAASLELHGLSEVAATELARELGPALPERVRQRIIERAEGIPLYLEESLRMLSQGGAQAGAEVPAKLEDMLMVRLDALGPDRALAQLMSVLGRECSAAHLQALLEQDDPFVKRARQQGSVEALTDCGLLQPLESPLAGYRFKHALLRDAAYASLWTHDRKRLHGLCADLIERANPELQQQRPEQLAQHLEAAGRLEPARRAWSRAAQLAATRHAHHETVELAQRGLALHTQPHDDADHARSAMQLHLLLASAQIALRGYGSAEVEVAYQAAERASHQLADATYGLRVRLGLEACYVMRGDLQRASELAQAAVASTDWARDMRLALQSRWALANVQFHQGDWSAALAGFDDCLARYQIDQYRRSGVQDPAVICLGYSAWIHFELGQADEALRRIDRMLALATALQHPFSHGVALGFAASIKRLCGDVDGAWPHALEAVRVCERGGFQVWLAHAWMVRGQLRSDRGEVREGADDMDHGYALWVEGGARISCATYLATQAEVLLRQGQTQRAASQLETARQISRQIGERYYQAELLRLQGLCAWQAGEQLSGERALLEALALAERQSKPGLALRCALSLGALQVAQGRWQEPVQRLRRWWRQVPQHGRCRDARWARQALLCWEAGQAFDSLTHTPWEPR